MKKFLCVLIAVLAVFALAAAGGYGAAWYRSNHVFIEGDAYPLSARELDLRDKDISVEYYNELRSQLPDCAVSWMVPFQGSKYDSSVTSLVIESLSQEEADYLLAYLPELKVVDALQSRDYAVLSAFQDRKPDCQVLYEIDLGGSSWALDVTDLELRPGEYTYDALMENLPYLNNVQTVLLHTPELTGEELESLRARYPEITFSCTVEILGTEYDSQTKELNLSALQSSEVPAVAEKLPELPQLEAVELMSGESSSLNKEDVKLLIAAAPQVRFHYVFDFFGQTVSADTEEVSLKNVNIGDENEAEVRAALDLLPSCKRMILDNCKLSNEVLAKIRDDYRDQTKVVWRVWFGKGSSLTDAQLLRVVGDLLDKNCQDLKYMEDVVAMDLGHNEYLTTAEFVSGMVNLEYCIISGAPIKDLTPFSNCKKLKFLEIAFCDYLSDVSPLAACENLEMLNIGNTHIVDLSPLDDLPLTHLMARMYPGGVPRVSKEEQARFTEKHPDCWASFTGSQPYGDGWRYDTDGVTPLPVYQQIRDWMLYDIYPKTPNHKGWYFDTYNKEA